MTDVEKAVDWTPDLVEAMAQQQAWTLHVGDLLNEQVAVVPPEIQALRDNRTLALLRGMSPAAAERFVASGRAWGARQLRAEGYDVG